MLSQLRAPAPRDKPLPVNQPAALDGQPVRAMAKPVAGSQAASVQTAAAQQALVQGHTVVIQGQPYLVQVQPQRHLSGSAVKAGVSQAPQSRSPTGGVTRDVNKPAQSVSPLSPNSSRFSMYSSSITVKELLEKQASNFTPSSSSTMTSTERKASVSSASLQRSDTQEAAEALISLEAGTQPRHGETQPQHGETQPRHIETQPRHGETQPRHGETHTHRVGFHAVP